MKWQLLWNVKCHEMLDLWPQAETPGVTHFGAYHRLPDGHFLSDSVGWPDPEFSGTGVQCSYNIHWADQEATKGNILFTSKHVANNCSLRYGCNILTDACSHTISFINTARMIIAHSLSNQNMAFAFMIERLLWHCARVKSVFATPGVILLGGHSISLLFLYKMVK